jgi:rhamnose utilization protein RhaD (predicted bifunctional aldolase and dehydrogenase)
MKNINEGFSKEESKEIYDKFLAIVNSRRNNLVKTYGRSARPEQIAYSTAVNQVKKKAQKKLKNQAANNVKQPTSDTAMDKETKLKEMIQAALSKPLDEKKKPSSFTTSDMMIRFNDKRKDLPDGLKKLSQEKQGNCRWKTWT